MSLWTWLRSKISAKKLAKEAAEAAVKAAVDEIVKATKTEGQWQ